MAETPSSMIPLGTKAPDFELFDTVSEKKCTLNQLRSDVATVILFICNHCPYVKLIQEKLVATAKNYQAKGITFVAISSNDATTYPADSPEKMHEEALHHHYSFPYLHDETQAVAKAYHAACTPDIYVFDKNLLCVYRGRFDDATPGNGRTVTGNDLINALDCILDNKPVDGKQIPSVGCNIKWKK